MYAVRILAICALALGFVGHAQAQSLTATVNITNSSTSTAPLVLGYNSADASWGTAPPSTIAVGNGTGNVVANGTSTNVSAFMIYKTAAGNGCSVNLTAYKNNGVCTYNSAFANPIGSGSCSFAAQKPQSCDGILTVTATVN